MRYGFVQIITTACLVVSAVNARENSRSSIGILNDVAGGDVVQQQQKTLTAPQSSGYGSLLPNTATKKTEIIQPTDVVTKSIPGVDSVPSAPDAYTVNDTAGTLGGATAPVALTVAETASNTANTVGRTPSDVVTKSIPGVDSVPSAPDIAGTLGGAMAPVANKVAKTASNTANTVGRTPSDVVTKSIPGVDSVPSAPDAYTVNDDTAGTLGGATAPVALTDAETASNTANTVGRTPSDVVTKSIPGVGSVPSAPDTYTVNDTAGTFDSAMSPDVKTFTDALDNTGTSTKSSFPSTATTAATPANLTDIPAVTTLTQNADMMVPYPIAPATIDSTNATSTQQSFSQKDTADTQPTVESPTAAQSSDSETDTSADKNDSNASKKSVLKDEDSDSDDSIKKPPVKTPSHTKKPTKSNDSSTPTSHDTKLSPSSEETERTTAGLLSVSDTTTNAAEQPAPAAPAVPLTPDSYNLESQEAQAKRAQNVSGNGGPGTSALFAAAGCFGCVAIIAIVAYAKKQNRENETTVPDSECMSVAEARSSEGSVYNDPLGTRYSSIVMITPNGDGVCIL